MAFPWDLFERLSLATSNIVEDLQLGLESGYLGYPPLLAEDATVWSASATQAATVDQRRRWEGGFLQTAIWAAPPLFAKSLLRGDLRGAWAGLDLAVPPFALLILIDASAIALAGALNLWLGSSPWPAAMLLSAVFFAGLALFLGWRAGGSDFVSLRALARAPLYVIWKLPIYFRVVYQGAPKEWERTDRA
jgi:hypothetical protein